MFCQCVFKYTMCLFGAPGGNKKVSDPLKLLL